MFVSRNQGNAINGVFARPQFPGQEQLPDNDPAILAFLAGLATPDGGASLLSRVTALEKLTAAIAAVPVVATGLANPIPVPATSFDASGKGD